MRPARILLILVALIAGGLAAFLATRGDRPASPLQVVTTEIVPEARTQILVAKRPIGVGERLSAAALEWQDWPAGAIRPEYVTIGAMPDALTEMTDAVARFEFFTGEPIREQKLVRSDQGYLSAVLSEGMRGVSIAVTGESAAGGYVVPNDRVDVVLTRSTDSGQLSETILSNVKVLAIGKRLGEVDSAAPVDGEAEATAESRIFEDETIATLELDPQQGETLVNAASIGELSLALRSIVDFDEVIVPGFTAQTSSAIRIIRYGKEFSVLPAAGQYGDVAPAATELEFSSEPVVIDPAVSLDTTTDPGAELQ